MKAKPSDIVRYCPGGAVGSPAWMTREEALDYLGKDSLYVEKMVRHSGGKTHYPHIGQCTSGCPQYNRGN